MSQPYRDWSRKKLDYESPQKVLRNLIQHSRLTPMAVEVPTVQALGLRLAEDIIAPQDRPPWDLSHVDGYAVRTGDLERHECLSIAKGVDPRAAHVYEMKPGEAVYVDTGFPLPRGADAVVPVENAVLDRNDSCIRVPRVKKGENVIPRGVEYRRGQVLARRGERLTGAHARLLLDAGFPRVKVFRRARVVLIPVGDELSPPPLEGDAAPPEGRVWESSTIMVRGLLSHLPVEVRVMGIVGDRPGDIVSAVREALEEGPDLVATIGGVSVGRKDQTWLALKEALEPRYYYRGIRVVQGRVNSGMAMEGAVVLNLPGFVQSTFTGTMLFLAPLVNWLTGGPLNPGVPCWRARLAEPVEVASRRDFYRMRFAYPSGDDPVSVVIEPHVESSMALPLTRSLGFVVIPPGRVRLEEGEEVTVYDHLHRRGRLDCGEWPFSPSGV